MLAMLALLHWRQRSRTKQEVSDGIPKQNNTCYVETKEICKDQKLYFLLVVIAHANIIVLCICS